MSGSTLPLSPVTSTDHRGWLWITVITCTIICPILLLGRAIVRHKRYGLDDLAIFLSFVSSNTVSFLMLPYRSKEQRLIRRKQVFVMAHTALLMESLELGFGVQLTPGTQVGILEAAKVTISPRGLQHIN
jgi:hypothetical protein